MVENKSRKLSSGFWESYELSLSSDTIEQAFLTEVVGYLKTSSDIMHEDEFRGEFYLGVTTFWKKFILKNAGAIILNSQDDPKLVAIRVMDAFSDNVDSELHKSSVEVLKNIFIERHLSEEKIGSSDFN